MRNMTQEKLDEFESYGQESISYDEITLIKHPLLNKKAPPIVGHSMSEKEFDLDDNLGKVIHLNFWFLGCIPCLKQKKAINSLKEEFPNVEFISISQDSIEHLSEYIVHLDSTTFNIKKPYDFFGNRIAFDIIPNGKEIIDRYNFVGFPITFLINNEGMIVTVMRYSENYYENMSTLLNRI